MSLEKSRFWDEQYADDRTGWNIGYVSTPLKEYFDQLSNHDIDILVPGAGHGWECEYLFTTGFINTFYLDFSSVACARFINRVPAFPGTHILNTDFFSLKGNYDLIVEQTFFSSLDKIRRSDYVNQIHHLLKPGGKLVGLLFNHEFGHDFPPFGGNAIEYMNLFTGLFEIEVLEIAYNSIKPRRDRELFVLLRRV